MSDTVPASDEVEQYLLHTAEAVHGDVELGGRNVKVVALSLELIDMRDLSAPPKPIYLVLGSDDVAPLTRDLTAAAADIPSIESQLTDHQETSTQ